MIKPFFGNIRNVLIEKLKDSSFDVYIAVAWITDKKYEEILIDLLNRGISVTIITVHDETNLSGGINWIKLVENGGQIYWCNHHHKFCVIDRRLVLTGSFNWTVMASSRNNRENILMIDDEKEIIEQYSLEFMKLKTNSTPLLKKPKVKEIIVEKVVRENVTSLHKYNAYKTRKDELLCGKCSNEIHFVFDTESIPPKLRRYAKYYCNNCGSYFSDKYEFL